MTHPRAPRTGRNAPKSRSRGVAWRPGFDRLEGRALLSTFAVNTTADENTATAGAGRLSLRNAILQANANPGPDTITVPAGTYRLTIAGSNEDAGQTGDLDISGDTTIIGAGAGSTTINGGQIDRIFDVVYSTVAISGLTITGGSTPTTAGFTGEGALTNGGGGVRSSYANTTFTSCVIAGNATGRGLANRSAQGGFGGDGGGIKAEGGSLTLVNTTVSGNTTGNGDLIGGDGGGISGFYTAMSITGGAISNNVTGTGQSNLVTAGRGGGIKLDSSTLTIASATVGGNTSGTSVSQGMGGGIYITNTSSMSMADSVVSGNTTSYMGGGIYNDGTIGQISRSTISGNRALGSQGGGGIYNQVGTITLISGSTISGNQAPNTVTSYGGGGLSNSGSIGTIVNSTFSGNSTNGKGGGLNNSKTISRIANVTIAGNTASDGGGLFHMVFSNSTPVIGAIVNTIIAGNSAVGSNPKDFTQLGQLDAATNNLIQAAAGHQVANGVNGNIVGVAAQLGALADNGGPTMTQAPLAGSPALDAGSNAQAPATDQRGLARPFNGVADIGAVEVQVARAPAAVNDSYAVAQGGTLVVGGSPVGSAPLLRLGFDESGAGASAAADSGVTPAANGTFAGSATRTPSTPRGFTKGALDLSAPGINSVSSGDANKLDNLSALTVTAWINLRAAPVGYDVLFSDMPTLGSTAGEGGWELRLNRPYDNGSPLSASNFALEFSVGQSFGSYLNAQGTNSGALNASDQWVFIAVTFDADQSLTYYRGDTAQAVGQIGYRSVLSYRLAGNSSPFLIGAAFGEPNTDRTPPAYLDDVRVYGSSLSATQLDRVRRENLGLGVLANDSQPDGNPLSATLVDGPAHGTLALNPDGTFTYTPTAGFSGVDQFTYRAVDGQSVSAPATVTITVQAPAATFAIAPISPATRHAPIDQASFSFSRPVYGLGLSSLSLTRDGGPNLLTSAQVLSSSTNVDWTLGNLAGITAAPGNYVLTLSPSGVVNSSGAAVVGTASASFRVLATYGVVAMTPTPSGVTVRFNRAFDLARLNLYDAAGAGLGPADVTLVGAQTGPVRGSLVPSADGRSFSFIKTGGPLADDVYTLTLRGGAGGFADAAGAPLDGNADGVAGDDYARAFSASAAPFAASVVPDRYVALPDFARGPGQAVDVPATGSGLPVTISDGTGVSRVVMTVAYDPALLTLSGVALGASAPAGASATIRWVAPGLAEVTFASPTPLAAGPAEFARLIASVPSSAPYASAGLLAVGVTSINDGAIVARGDAAVHAVAYLGDTTGNGRYSGLDASLALRYVGSVDSGFVAYPSIDPSIVGDISGNGLLSGLDVSYLLQFIGNQPVGLIPPLPPAPTALADARGGDAPPPAPRDGADVAPASPDVAVLVPLPTPATLTAFDLAIEALAPRDKPGRRPVSGGKPA